jgi:hypothetical protein
MRLGINEPREIKEKYYAICRGCKTLEIIEYSDYQLVCDWHNEIQSCPCQTCLIKTICRLKQTCPHYKVSGKNSTFSLIGINTPAKEKEKQK